MKRFLRMLLGLVLLLLGLGSAAVGGLGVAVFGQQGSVIGPSERLTANPASAAIVADLAGTEVALPFAHLLGVPTLTVSSIGGGSVFVGTGEQSAVDAYLFGIPYDLATRSAEWNLTPVPGVGATAPEPRDQSFWTERSVGTRATIELAPGSTPQTLVVVNSDGSAGVSVEAALGFRGERIFWYSVAAIALGAILIVLGLLLMLRRRKPPAPADPDVVELASPGTGDGSLEQLLQEPTTGSPAVREP